MSFDFRNTLDSSDSNSRNRRNFDRNVLQSLDLFIDDATWNNKSTLIIINIIHLF